MAPISITYERSQVVDFTFPFQTSGNVLICLRKGTLELLLYPDGSTVFLYSGLQIASK